MKSNKLLFPAGKNDECYTPAYFVELILPYLPAGAVVWCPFDTAESEFVKLITAKGHKVIYSHKDAGQDFHNYMPDEPFDVVLTNPAFTGKRETLDRILSFGKPFAIVMTCAWFNDASLYDAFLLVGRNMQWLFTNKRVDYQGTGKITFMSGYLCCDFLPRDIMIAPLKTPSKSKRKNITIK